MEEDFVLETINLLIKNHKKELKTDSLIHSDQGIHYKVVLFKDLLNNNNLRQSMSRKANCWDNAAQESFHGHIKDEIDLSSCKTFEDVKEVIDNYSVYSKETAKEMAYNIAKFSNSDLGVGITGRLTSNLSEPKGVDICIYNRLDDKYYFSFCEIKKEARKENKLEVIEDFRKLFNSTIK